jgi:Tfp pilus assembly protein PilZ
MTSSAPHFLVVASHLETKKHYCKKLDSLSVKYSIVESPKELHVSPQDNSFHGLVIDIHNFVKLPIECKNIIKDFTQVLPTLKVFISNEEFMVNYSSFETENIRILDDFITKCSKQPARTLRRDQRYNIFLNALISEKTCNITDLSKRGCFILSTDLSYNLGEYIELFINELSDKTPLTVLVRRCIKWGTNFMASGIGTEFISMSESQREELDLLLTKHIEKTAEAEKAIA